MANLVALEMTLGPKLLDAISQVRDNGDAFCILDPRDSELRRAEVLRAIRPTHVLRNDGSYELSEGEPLDDGDGLVMLTSGSSGTPKAAIHTWDALDASARLTSDALGSDAVWWATLPPVHIGGLAVLLRSLYRESPVIFATTVRDALEQGATHVAVVRTQLFREDFSDFACVLLGGAAPPAHLASNVVTTWGMTETGSGVVYDGQPLPEVSLACDDDEILVASPTLFRSYRDSPRPERILGDTSYFPTGDGGRFENGLLSVSGRRAYVINTGGEKVWPERLEEILSSLDGVRDLAIVGRDDDEWGQVITLVVAPTGTASNEDILAAARGLVRQALGPWAQPKAIYSVAAIPRTPNGKIQRSALAELIRS